MDSGKRFMTLEEAAGEAGLTKKTLCNWLYDNVCPFPIVNMGRPGAKRRTLRVPVKPFRRWLRGREKKALDAMRECERGGGGHGGEQRLHGAS